MQEKTTFIKIEASNGQMYSIDLKHLVEFWLYHSTVPPAKSAKQITVEVSGEEPYQERV